MTSINDFTENCKTDVPALIPMVQIFATSRMVAYISHDLRQPLTAILANAEFLARPDLSEMERIEFFREIRGDVDRIDALLSSLLKGSKGRDALKPAARNIVHTVECAVRMIRVRREFHRIDITHNHKGNAVGWFDANRLERVIANLALNACEAVDPGSGQIVITTTGGRDSLQICVWDNGPGISSAIRGSIFRSPVSYGKPAGCGLGLVIAKTLVEDHGGTIYLDEKCERGTSFFITIPFAINGSDGA
jgi:signal transduction histidine kinase